VDQKQKEGLANTISELNAQINDLGARVVENNLMFREEVAAIKL
jgi:hypothetical protein